MQLHSEPRILLPKPQTEITTGGFENSTIEGLKVIFTKTLTFQK